MEATKQYITLSKEHINIRYIFNLSYENSFATRSYNKIYDDVESFKNNSFDFNSDNLIWKQSTVGNSNLCTNVVDETIRNSYYCDSLKINNKIFNKNEEMSFIDKKDTYKLQISFYPNINRDYDFHYKINISKEEQKIRDDKRRDFELRSNKRKELRSQFNNDIVGIFEDIYDRDIILNDIYSRYVNEFSSLLDFNHNSDYNIWKMLKYEVRCKFEKHSDGKKNEKHLGKFILIPPLDVYYFQGGDLILYPYSEETQNCDNEPKIIKPNETNWTIVYIPIGQLHEVTEVTNGTRYVFTMDYFMSDKALQIMNAEKYNDSIDISNTTENEKEKYIKVCENIVETNKRKIEIMYKKIAEMEETNKEISDKMSLFKNNTLSSDNGNVLIKSILEKYDGHLPDTTFGIICNHYYTDKKKEKMYVDDKILYNELIELINKKNDEDGTKYGIRFVNVRLEIKEDDDLQNIGFHEIKDECIGWNSSEMESNTDTGVDLGANTDQEQYLLLYYYNYCENYIPGYVHNVESVYNDQTYDYVNLLRVTVMVVEA